MALADAWFNPENKNIVFERLSLVHYMILTFEENAKF